ncbi:neprilysin-4-like [Oppia nitens]|uniref:neprilysin-4-like n=1 Tax=Oppia nitens TaxID=1686743 RepID=UPI0023DBB088|nr:neprilysin-4-like [Oppia nitens]
MKSSTGQTCRFSALFIIAMIAIICLTVVLLRRHVRVQQNLCLTSDCITAASDLLKSMDRTVDPCNDFFEYACGGWTHHNNIDEDESRTDTFTIMRNQLTNKLKSILETPIADNESNSTKKAKTLYQSCINEELIEKRGSEPLVKLLKELGDWPLLMTNNTSNTYNKNNELSMNWVKLMGTLRQYNNEIIIGHNVGPYEYNASTYAIKLYPATLGLSSADFYQNTSSRQYKAYHKLIQEYTKLLNAPLATIESDIEDILLFESRLANISRPFEKNGGAAYQRMSIRKLSRLVPNINWKTYFELAIPVPINDTESVGIYGLDYFIDVQELVDQTNQRTMVNYLLWRFVMNRANNLDSRFEKVQQDYYKEIFGTKSQSARWKKCIDYVNNNMGMAASALYVHQYFTSDSKAKADEIIENIKLEFYKILEEITWMDQETKHDAKTKATVMEQHIGYPDYLNDNDKLDEEYAHFNFEIDKYFENVVGFLKNSTNKTQSKLFTEVDKDKWTIMPSVVNAHYHRYRNLMSFPAAVLQTPLFDKNYPNSLNYGAIGSIVGHELTHGFDSNGRHHDQYGNQRLWWHPNTIDRFVSKSQCMVNQYNNYTIRVLNEDHKINGMLTLSENIADNGGIKQSFRAFKKLELKYGADRLLPGVNLTQNQLFFLKYAQNWCQSMTEEGMLTALKTWKHTPGKYRVIGALHNSRDFARAYNCPDGSPMNPVHKCEVW